MVKADILQTSSFSKTDLAWCRQASYGCRYCRWDCIPLLLPWRWNRWVSTGTACGVGRGASLLGNQTLYKRCIFYNNVGFKSYSSHVSHIILCITLRVPWYMQIINVQQNNIFPAFFSRVQNSERSLKNERKALKSFTFMFMNRYRISLRVPWHMQIVNE